ncbi:MAG: tyrosine-type recombinase/integrase, partial [Clostridiaceae bacterium]|nr:tyrosine-type recombinase/integrase [Clostridiaceae bacterium]
YLEKYKCFPAAIRLFPFGETAVYHRFVRILSRLDVHGKRITVHSLRHTFITRCAERGIHPKAAQKWVGHADPKLTTEVYTHINGDFEAEQIEILNGRKKV